MKTIRVSILVCLAMFLLTTTDAFARDAARDLKRMVGYTIIDASWVTDTIETKYGDKIIELGNGTCYKVNLLLLNPLPMTDVIIFAKKVENSILIKLLIDNEVYDAIAVKITK
jgi:hypothetical protein